MRSYMRSQEDLERLSQLHHELPNDLETLEIRLTDPNPLVRFAVVSKLRQLKDPRVVDPLLHALEDESSDVRSMAALSLSYYADARFLLVIIDHLAHDTSPGVRCMAAMVAGAIGTDEAMEALKLSLSDLDEHVRMTACYEFANINDLRALPEIQHLLSDSEDVVRSAASTVLVRLGKVDENVMNVLMDDLSWETRKHLAHELVRAKIADGRIIMAIEQLMKESEAVKYESQMAQYRMAVASDEKEDDGAEELSEEDQSEMRKWEELQDKPLAELLEKARALLDGQK